MGGRWEGGEGELIFIGGFFFVSRILCVVLVFILVLCWKGYDFYFIVMGVVGGVGV